MTTTKKGDSKPASATPRPQVAKQTSESQAKAKPQSPGATTKGPSKTPKPATDAKQLSALDAAAKILSESNGPMTTGEMIDSMAAKGYWKSPGGKTPAATLYSAILRELKSKGKDARFTKSERGKFALNK